jgi:hypothetical protein
MVHTGLILEPSYDSIESGFGQRGSTQYSSVFIGTTGGFYNFR